MILKPKRRSRLRKWLGKRYFIQKRRLKWWLGGQRFAYQFYDIDLPECIIKHQSFLLRKLRNVDMHLQYNKIINLEIAAKKISGIIIHPGEFFSFWHLVGQPTKWKGYLKGMMLNNGEVVAGTGGGLCQMSNLIYWMALHSPLTITERWRHSYDVFPDSNRTQPFGSGATLSFNYIDLQILNPTQQSFQIKIWLSDKHLHGSILCKEPISVFYKIIEKNHRITGQSWGGYTRHNEIYKEVYEKPKGELLQEELITSNQAIMMYQPFIKSSAEDV